jgi:hypothetical protein
VHFHEQQIYFLFHYDLFGPNHSNILIFILE